MRRQSGPAASPVMANKVDHTFGGQLLFLSAKFVTQAPAKEIGRRHITDRLKPSIAQHGQHRRPRRDVVGHPTAPIGDELFERRGQRTITRVLVRILMPTVFVPPAQGWLVVVQQPIKLADQHHCARASQAAKRDNCRVKRGQMVQGNAGEHEIERLGVQFFERHRVNVGRRVCMGINANNQIIIAQSSNESTITAANLQHT